MLISSEVSWQRSKVDPLFARTQLEDESAYAMFYYAAFAVYILMSLIKMTTFHEIFFVPVDIFETFATSIIIVLLAAKMLFQRARLSTWFFVIAISIIGFLSWQNAGEGWLFWLFLFVACGEGVSLYRLAFIALITSVIVVIYTTSCASLGIIENVIKYRPDGTTRYSMGFVHPNSFGLVMLMACTSFSVLRFDKHPAPSIVTLIIAALLSISVADSRTPALLAVLQICLLVIFHSAKTEHSRNLWRKIFLALIFGSVGISIFFMFFYSSTNSLFQSLDALVNGRFGLAHSYYELAPISLLGNDYSNYDPIFYNTEDGTASQFMVDNAYCHIILRYGLLPSLIFFSSFCSLSVLVYRQQRWDALLFGLVVMSLYAIEENMGTMVESNYFLVSAASLVIFRTVNSQSDLYVSKLKREIH